jgi:hypothetical protein
VKRLVLLLAATFAIDALAQPAVLTPAAPTSSDVITATFEVLPCPGRTVTTIVTGTLVTTTVAFDECVIVTPPVVHDTTTFGPLPVGVYTYEIYYDDGGPDPPLLRSRQTFAVQAPPIPSLSTWGLAAMIGALTLAALWSAAAKPPLS